MFGSPHRKNLWLTCVRARFLDVLAVTCDRSHTHVQFNSGTLNKKSAQYPSLLCVAWAQALAQARKIDAAADLGRQDLETARSQEDTGHELLWANELFSSIHWDLVY